MTAFLPNTLEGWVTVTAVAVGWAIATQRVWQNLVNKVNGVGARVALLEERKAENGARIHRLEDGQATANTERARMHEIVGGLVKEHENLMDQITELKIDVIGHINEVKTLIKEDSGALRERMVRLEVLAEMKQRGEIQ